MLEGLQLDWRVLGAGQLSLSLCGPCSSAEAPFCGTTGNSTEPCVFSRRKAVCI